MNKIEKCFRTKREQSFKHSIISRIIRAEFVKVQNGLSKFLPKLAQYPLKTKGGLKWSKA